MKTVLRTAVALLLTIAVAACGAPAPTPAATPNPARTQELRKFESPQDFLAKSGPAGTAWDRQYRSFIQTDQDATSKGLPTHAQAAADIKADAATSSDRLQAHKSYILYIKHYSQAYRPESVTADLGRLYTELVDMEFGVAAHATAPAAAALPFAGDSRLTIHRNVVYGTSDSAMQRLDAYLVKAGKPTAVLIEFHGGGWRRGQKSQFDGVYAGNLIGRVLDAGVSVVSVDYRLTPAHQYPAQVQDAARAVQFVRSKAREWNIDPQRVAAIGGSAGAHLAAWVALHDDLANPAAKDAIERQSSRLSCFVDEWGPMDLTRADPLALSKETLRGEDFANAYIALFGTTLEGYNTNPEVQTRIKEASPLFYVDPGDPPALIIHQATAELARRDHPPIPAIVSDPHSAWHGILLAEAMEAAGLQAVRYIGPEVGKDTGADNETTVGFLNKCLAGP